MNILTLFVVIPILMLAGLWLSKNDNQVRGVMVAGSTCLLGLAIYLVFAFLDLRETMPADQYPMLFTYSVPWFEPLNIEYAIGVDGISVVMIYVLHLAGRMVRAEIQGVEVVPFGFDFRDIP